MNKPSVSVIVPVYNSQGTLRELASRLGSVLPPISSQFELILVNDGSRDASWQVIESLVAEYVWLQGINLMRNYGQHNALLAGIRQARYEIIVTLDDDLQNPPEEISLLLAKLADGADVVYGTPKNEEHGLWRNLASQITKLALQNAMGASTARKVSAFRAFRAEICKAFINYQGPFINIDVLLTWGTTRFEAVLVNHAPRTTGASNYTLRKLITHALNMITGFTVLPLQIASMMGFLFAGFGGVVLFYVIGRYLIEGGSVPGFPFIASIIALFSGAQLFTIGIIGEYLARMHFRLMDKPAYTIRQNLAHEEHAEVI